MPAARKKQFRFRAKQDVLLLQEVLAQNPYSSDSPSNAWATIAENLDMDLNGRRARERTSLLLDYFRKNNTAMLRRSGTEEEYDEKDRLLQEVADLEDEGSRDAKAKSSAAEAKAVRLRKAGQAIRQKAMEGMKEDRPQTVNEDEENEEATPEEPTPKKAKGQRRVTAAAKGSEVIEYLKEKNDQESSIKKDELSFRREELELQKERLQLEKQKLEMETPWAHDVDSTLNIR